MIKLTRVHDGVWHIKSYEDYKEPVAGTHYTNYSFISDEMESTAIKVMKDRSLCPSHWSAKPSQVTYRWHNDGSKIACFFICILTDGEGTHIKTNGAALVLKPWNLYMVRWDVLHKAPYYYPQIWRIILRYHFWKTPKRLALLEKYNSKKVTYIDE